MPHDRAEIEAVMKNYVAVRENIDAGQGTWTLIYAGDGKFRYEEDILNMVHVLEDMKESHCKVKPVAMPPRHPSRDFSRPA
ncbi:MAG: hypothetical protein SGJ13_15650 [Actinomycetota bacterium]|nr:hypothetical protein [Actinomycetota bacterium]